MTKMEKTITMALINMKGGVGKTTLTANIAYALAKFHNKKVLLIDNDPQFNATQYFVPTDSYIKYIENPSKCTVLDIYVDRTKVVPSIVSKKMKPIEVPKPTLTNSTIPIYSGSGKLDLIPSTLNLMEIIDVAARGTEIRLKKFINNIKDAYDFIFIDCPPTMSLFTLSAYLAADAYIIPIKPDHLSSIGTSLIERAIEKYEDTYGHNIKQVGIVFTMVKLNSRLMKDTMSTIRKTSRICFKNYLRDSTQIAKAVKYNKALFEYDVAKAYGEEVKNITDELLTLI